MSRRKDALHLESFIQTCTDDDKNELTWLLFMASWSSLPFADGVEPWVWKTQSGSLTDTEGVRPHTCITFNK
jgi:hypothetical protein